MADQVTPADKTPDEIEQEMLITRESLSSKVAALEHQVVGTVQSAADTITDTVAAVKSLVSNAPETVSETVKQTAAAVGESMKKKLDISNQVRQHPLAAVGVSALLGCMVGYLTAPSRRSFSALAAANPPASQIPTPRGFVDHKPGIMDEFMGMVGEKVKELARTAMETASGAVKDSIKDRVPKLVDNAAERLTDTDGTAGADPFAARFDARRAKM